MGLGLFGQGLGARAQDASQLLGQAGLFGGLGTNLLGLGSQFGSNLFGSSLDFSNLGFSRALQNIGLAQGLFGFGQDLGIQDFNQVLSSLGAVQGIDQSVLNLLALGGNVGGTQAAAGANIGQLLLQGSSDPFGALLTGLGGGLFSGLAAPAGAT